MSKWCSIRTVSSWSASDFRFNETQNLWEVLPYGRAYKDDEELKQATHYTHASDGTSLLAQQASPLESCLDRQLPPRARPAVFND